MPAEPRAATRPFEVIQVRRRSTSTTGLRLAPEQGGWTLDELRSLEADLGSTAGFLWETAGGWPASAGPRAPPPRSAAGDLCDRGRPGPPRRGLGRALALAGLDHLAAALVGMLYVDADQRVGQQLYNDLGTTASAVAYVGDLDAQPPCPTEAWPIANGPIGRQRTLNDLDLSGRPRWLDSRDRPISRSHGRGNHAEDQRQGRRGPRGHEPRISGIAAPTANDHERRAPRPAGIRAAGGRCPAPRAHGPAPLGVAHHGLGHVAGLIGSRPRCS